MMDDVQGNCKLAPLLCINHGVEMAACHTGPEAILSSLYSERGVGGHQKIPKTPE